MRSHRPYIPAIVLLAFIASAGAESPRPTGPIFDIPRLADITIDGKPDDWKGNGFHVEVLSDSPGELKPSSPIDARFRLGWDDKGLVLLLTVRDDTGSEASQISQLWQADSAEIFLANCQGGDNLIQAIIAPGRDERFKELRSHVMDHRRNDPLKASITPTVEAARSLTEDAYVIEARLPWSAVGVTPKRDTESAFTLYVNNVDESRRRGRVVWHTDGEATQNRSALHRIRLSDSASPAVCATTSADCNGLRHLRIQVLATSDLAGSQCKVETAMVGVSTTLTAEGSHATATAELPLIPGDKYDNTLVTIAGMAPMQATVPDIAAERLRAGMNIEVGPRPSVFTGTAFPPCTFQHPTEAEDLFQGKAKVQVQYYDAQFNPVTKPATPGRYGAVIHITCPDGRSLARRQTIYRAPKDFRWWELKLTGQPALPPELGVAPAVTAARAKEVNDILMWSFADLAERTHWPAICLAGLSEASPDEAVTAYNSPATRDRQYWVTLKRKLNGNDKRFPADFACPAKAKAPAPVLHEGAAAEAGMKPDAAKRLDAVLTQWAADSDEAFIACVVRHGVIVLHKAYGMRNGKPMTTDTPSYMASLSKLVSGTQIMMLVDQNRLDLDRPIDAYLPEMVGAKFNIMPTMRHLYTHTAGMESHRGSEDADLENLLAEAAPVFKVGRRASYNGMSLELGVKILEQVSGEAYPLFAQKHLLTPLGCLNTTALNASYDTQSTAIDMARIGQMLLNGGSYGEHVFFRPETRDRMLPTNLEMCLGPTREVIGIGTRWFTHPGLGERVFGHGAASSATLRIDLDKDLVISMTRNAAGRNFDKYHSLFMRTIAECLAEAPEPPSAQAKP